MTTPASELQRGIDTLCDDLLALIFDHLAPVSKILLGMTSKGHLAVYSRLTNSTQSILTKAFGRCLLEVMDDYNGLITGHRLIEALYSTKQQNIVNASVVLEIPNRLPGCTWCPTQSIVRSLQNYYLAGWCTAYSRTVHCYTLENMLDRTCLHLIYCKDGGVDKMAQIRYTDYKGLLYDGSRVFKAERPARPLVRGPGPREVGRVQWPHS